MIYCVVPGALADELYDKLVTYYKDDLNVEVIIDRRRGARQAVVEVDQDERRRRRVPGTFPEIEPGKQ